MFALAFKIFVTGLLCLVFFLPASGCRKTAEETPDVILLHTGRIRGNIYPMELQAMAPLQHYQFIAGYVRALRNSVGRDTGIVLLDLGDSLEGSFASHVTESQNVVSFFNYLEYDAVLLGNLDNRVTPEVVEQIDAPVLNPFLDSEGKVSLAGTSVATKIQPPNCPPIFLVSNFYGDTAKEEHPDRFPTSFGGVASGVEPARDLESAIASLGPRSPGSLTVFAWMKFEAPEQRPREFLQRLREAGVDVIVAQRIYGTKQRDIWSESTLPGWVPPVSQNILRNNGGFTLARMDLKFREGRWEVLNQELIPMTSNSAKADQGIIERESQFAEQIRAADRSVGDLLEGFGEREILTMFLAALTSVPGADVVVYSPQSIRSHWPPGELRASTVFQSVPWTGPLVRCEMPRDALAKLLENNQGWEFWQRDESVSSSGNLQVVTSRFFADILSRQLELDPALMQLVEPAEYDFFVRFLSASPEPLQAVRPDGWQLLNAPRESE